MDAREARAHAGRMLGGGLGLYDIAHEAMPSYIWYWGDKKHRRGWCTHCRQVIDLADATIGWYDDLYDAEWECDLVGHKEWQQPGFERRRTTEVQHKMTGVCPACWTRVEFRRESAGHKYMVDRKMLVRYGRSAIEQDAWVCVGYLITNDWSGGVDPREVTEDVEPVELCVFRWGKPAHRFVAGWDADQGVKNWKRRKECISGWSPGSSMGVTRVPTILDRASYTEAVEDTRAGTVLELVQHWDVDALTWYDGITLMAKVTRYPQIEYLAKLGLVQLAKAIISGDTGGLLNLRGKTAQQVLRLTGSEWGEVKGKKLNLDVNALRVHRLANNAKLRLSMEQCLEMSRTGGGWYAFRDLCCLLPWLDKPRVLRYCRKQHIGINDYMDYARQLAALDVDPADYDRLYPRDFHAAHQREIERQRTITDRKQDEAIARQAERLRADYTFRACGLELRPFVSGAELVQEGNVQHICIGSYAARYAKGDTILCALRRVEDPARPWHAVEFTTEGRLVQCRGERNQTNEDEVALVRLFWAAWDAWHHTQTQVHLRIRRRTDAA